MAETASLNHTPGSSGRSPENSFLCGGGEMGERIAAFEWSQTPLGSLEAWPQSLRTSVNLMLNSKHPMWIGWGPEMTFLYNDAYLTVLGLAKHPWALGRPASKVWAEIWDICGPLADKVFLKGEATFVDDFRLFMRRGPDFFEETFYSFSYSPIRDESGEVGGLFCPSSDVTARNLHARRLGTLSELAAKALVEKSISRACASAMSTLSRNPDDIPFALLYLIEDQGQGAILEQAVRLEAGSHLAPASVAISGEKNDASAIWPVAEVLRTAVERVVDTHGMNFPLRGGADQPIREAIVLPVSSPGQERPLGVLVAGVNPARKLDTEYRTFFTLVAGQIATAVASARASEEERRRAEALAELDRAKTAFFSNISHELRTPLTLMLGPLQDIIAKPENGVLPDNRRLAELAHRNGLRLLKLVNTLLDFSRIEAGRVEASYEPVDLSAFTADLASCFRSAIENAGIRLVLDCPTLPEPVYVDREMWEKIVLNLLSNAFKFTFQGEIKVSLQWRGERVELSVADTGAGIPAAELPRIFERFHRVRGTRSRTHEGTGIGLALVQELARFHGGEVTVHSVEGKGTTFTVSIQTGREHLPAERISAPREQSSTGLGATPFVTEASRWVPSDILDDTCERGVADLSSAPLLPALAPGRGGRAPRLLLADDNADMRAYVSRLLSASYQVESVPDGEAALNRIRQNPPDLVLTDVMMPRLDGFGLLQQLRRDDRTRTIPVIMLSARAGEEARLEGLEAGADEYLVKPFSARELLARVRSQLEMNRVRRETEQRIKDILDSITSGFHATDAQGRYSYLNEAARKMFGEQGLNPDEVIGRTILEVFPQAKGTPAVEAHERALRDRVTVELENYYKPWQRWFFVRHFPTEHGGVSTLFEDITERKLAHQALQQRTAQFEALLNQAPLGIFLVDADFRLRHVNPAALPVFAGIPNALGSGFEQIIRTQWPEAHAAETIRRFRHTLETGEPFHVSECIQTRLDRGVKEYYEWQINRIPLPDGRFGVVCYFRDISAQVKAREVIAESEERYRTLVSVLTDVPWSTDPSGAFVDPQPAWAAYTGQTPEQYLGFGWANAIHPEDRAEVRRLWDEACRNRTPYESRGRVWHAASRQYRYFEARGAPILNSDGTLREWVGTCTDVHERKLAEELVRQSAERLRFMAESMPQKIFTARPNGEIDYFNQQWIEFTGLSFEQIRDWGWLQFIHPDDLQENIRRWKHSIDTGEYFEMEHRFRRSDGVFRWHLSRAHAMRDAQGKVLMWIGSNTDIDDQKRAEERLEQTVAERTSRLKETIAELEAFSYSVSHDLRSPLRAMQGYSEALLEEGANHLPPASRTYLERIRRAAARLDRLTQEVLTYSRLSRAEITLQPLSPEKLIREIIEQYPNLKASAGNICIEEPLPEVMGHEAFLTQALSNLLSNAVKFVQPGSEPRVRVFSETEGERVRLNIEDSGIGIDPKYQHRIFQMFGRVHPESKYEGTGIGLAIVKKTVERMNGRVGFETVADKGSRFWIELPRA